MPRTLTLCVTGAAAVVLGLLTLLVGRFPDVGILEPAVVVVLSLPAIVLGTVLALRRPRAVVAPLLALLGTVLLLVVGLGDEVVAVWAAHPEARPGPAVRSWFAAAAAGSWVLLYLPTAFLLLVFPDGRLPGRWRRGVARAVGVLAAVFLVAAGGPAEGYDPPLAALATPPYRVPEVVTALGPAVLLGLLVLLVACAVAMIQRHRHAVDATVRAQVRWFALGALLLPATLLLCWLSYLLFDTPDLVMIGIGLTAVGIPVVTTIALLRHDLYDVDRAFSATVTYTAVTTALLAVFAVAETAAGALLGSRSPVAAAVATAACALALSPLRSRLRGGVDRRLYPLRQGVRVALTALRRRIDAGQSRPEDLPEVLRTALRDPALRVGYVLPGRTALVDEHGALLPEGVPVTLSGTQVGALLPGGGPATRELLRETAAESALLVELIRSRLELTEALREVAESRARLLQAGYRERRRLERDLHDGAQQRLVSLGMAIRLAQRRLDSGADEDVQGLLDQAVAELSTAVAELRAIAQGLRPLDLDAGLGPAIRSLTTGLPIPVRLEVAEDAVPDEVATTAYYVASEALANVVKHADAEAVDIRVERHPEHVLVRVSDDGRGGAVARPGSGLAGLVDRVAAAGGRLSVGGSAGTTVEAILPCAP
ncbi:histidine kinase [Pseudonocardia sp. WMMC193]|uniref:histidine kinase n=1 Tax=Pseudonocardia sp. WMMC193 TaxID=2911965 RepID=UPI001F01EAD8|nr:histidine kinase [Pseudonocardia sp. WMMC193]MCF7551094.1 histidine kinase [Pseudonocardia sp. WMMC193]